MTFSSILGLAGCGLLLVALAATALRLQARAIRIRTAVVLAAAFLAFVPIGDLSLAGYARGAIGDLSITTLALAASGCFVRLTGKRLNDEREVNALCWLAAGAGLFLYPFALGWTPFDPYALGYGSIALTTVLLLVTLAAWHARLNLVVLIVLAGVVAYLAGVYESRNLWDYLIDPLAASYALVRLAAGTLRGCLLKG
jgi:hypothetical protein